jgi:hypothetical protein
LGAITSFLSFTCKGPCISQYMRLAHLCHVLMTTVMYLIRFTALADVTLAIVVVFIAKRHIYVYCCYILVQF